MDKYCPMVEILTNHVIVCAMEILFGVAVLAAFFWLTREKFDFEIQIDSGDVCDVRGEAPRGFARDSLQICKDLGIERARIRGRQRGDIMALDFSKDIPQQHQQRFRNALHFR